MELCNVELWHTRARPEVDERAFNVQLGCHIEEIVEMFQSLDLHWQWNNVIEELEVLSKRLKEGDSIAAIKDRKAFLDSLADQIVTSVGVGVCARMKVADAVAEVNRSNWSKFDQETGLPLFSSFGKILKGPNYSKPNLEGLY